MLGMSGGAWMFIWMMLVLKIPIVALLYIVWWAARQEPEPSHDDRGGGNDRHPHRPSNRPRPTPPRRGPHAGPPPRSPRRMRAKGKRMSPSHD
jgi:hypothetical protein